jgi:hypothetical protein
MLDLLNWPSFLAMRPLHMGKSAPIIILLSCVVEAGLQPKKGWNFMQSASRGINPASMCKAALNTQILPMMFTTSCGGYEQNLKMCIIPIPSQHVSQCWSFWSSPNHTPIKHRCLIKKSNQITSTCGALLYESSKEQKGGKNPMAKLQRTKLARMRVLENRHGATNIDFLRFKPPCHAS